MHDVFPKNPKTMHLKTSKAIIPPLIHSEIQSLGIFISLYDSGQLHRASSSPGGPTQARAHDGKQFCRAQAAYSSCGALPKCNFALWSGGVFIRWRPVVHEKSFSFGCRPLGSAFSCPQGSRPADLWLHRVDIFQSQQAGPGLHCRPAGATQRASDEASLARVMTPAGEAGALHPAKVCPDSKASASCHVFQDLW